jgi:mediator of replication checkpoint protein 1
MGSPAPEMLTPRSKVAKMLADIDNAPTPSPPAQSHASPTGEQTTYLDPARSSRAPVISGKTRGPFQADSSSESEDELDAPRRPKGRIARRMLGNGSSPSVPRSPSRHLASSPPARGLQNQGLNDESDDELYTATPQKSQQHAARPMDGSPAGSDAGGLFVSPAKPRDDESDDELPADLFHGNSTQTVSKERLAELVAKKREERLRREAEELEQRQRREQAGSPAPRTRKNQKGPKASRQRKTTTRPHGDPSSDLPDEVFETGQLETNPDVERIMSDAARPIRKASKKALLEMERETQRLARQQALAHQMKVKKKYTAADLLARFNMPPPGQSAPAEATQDTDAPAGTSSAPNSDGAESGPKDPVSTPPSSPPTAGPTPLQKQEAMVEQGALSKLVPVREDSISALAEMNSDDEPPDIDDVLSSSRVAKAPEVTNLPAGTPSTQDSPGRKGLRLARLGKEALTRQHEESDDEDLEIIAPLPNHLRVFDKVAAKPTKSNGADSKAIHTLRHLSRIGAYEGLPQKGSKHARPSVGPKALELQLRKKAKEQARQQQLERIAELKAKGIEIQTAEEREREAEVFENLLEKARLEAQELRKAERAAAKGMAGEGAGAVEISDDEDEDFDYEESGSEEDGEAEQDEEVGEEGDCMLDNAAEETDAEEVDEPMEVDLDEGDTAEQQALEQQEQAVDGLADGASTPSPVSRKPRPSRVVLDDEDEDEVSANPTGVLPAPTPKATAAEDNPFAAFNFGANNGSDSLMSPTQAFQATMQTPTQATQEDSLDILKYIPPPSVSSLPPSIPGHDDFETQPLERAGSQISMVPGSQLPESQRVNLAWETQSPETPAPANLTRGTSALSETPGWEPTQDPGLPSPWTLGLRRETTVESVVEEQETQETVRLRVSESPAPSARPLRRGRLVRRQATVLSDSSDDEAQPPAVKPSKKDAFREMARRRAAALDADERAEVEKEMKQMMEEQAEESEDEYAGLGGDDFVAPETEEDKAMIDSSHIDVDERALAAHFAERERLRNEEETNRLYKDLTTGALRRKQANTWGLEEDEDEIAMRRRQIRQREEARKRKLLLQDDNIAGLAQGRQSKGKDAFLKAIADDDDGDDILDLSDVEDDSQQPSPQDESQESQDQAQVKPLKEVSGNKRPLPDEEAPTARPPAKQRRTQASAFRKPTSMLEVRESLSFLLEEPDAQLAAPSMVHLDSESENDEEPEGEDGLLDDDEELEEEQARENDGGFAPNPADFDARAMPPPPPPPRLPASQRRTAPKPAVVDRLGLKRVSSTSSVSALGRRARSAGLTTGGFKVPSLLRRATTNVTSAANERGVTTSNFSRENSSGVKMGGTRKSSLAYQARAEERRAIVEASAKRREENTARIAQMRRNSSALGRGLTGRFE